MKPLSLLILFVLVTSASAQERTVYVLGSTLNLREAPTAKAGVVQKLPIATACVALGEPANDWLQVRCGDKKGYALAEFLGSEKPSADKLRAEARDSTLGLERREESALRAAMLAPDDQALLKELGQLFFAKNFDYLNRIQTPKTLRSISERCAEDDSPAECLHRSGGLSLIKSRVEARDGSFVVAFARGETLTVYRGRYQLTPKASQFGVPHLTGELLEQSSTPLTPVLDKALFLDEQTSEPTKYDVYPEQFLPSAKVVALLSNLPRVWAEVENNNPEKTRLLWSGCGGEPFQLEFTTDLHGRWLLNFIGMNDAVPPYNWIVDVKENDQTLTLTLVNTLQLKDRRRMSFKLPAPGKDIAASDYRKGTFFTFKPGQYQKKDVECPEPPAD